MKKIAVIGSGISGLSAAWALRDVAQVQVFESENRLGGHARTVDIDYYGKTISVDVGFIVCNPLNYPNFMQFMDALGVETQPSDMSFAVSDPKGYEWSSDRSGLFAQRRNLFKPAFVKMLLDILAFNKKAQADISDGNISPDLTLGAYLDQIGMTQRFKENYILPMGAAIWSTPEAEMMDYPAASFLNFFNNHKLLHTERPAWRTVCGGSRTYVSKVAEALGERVTLSNPVINLTRRPEGVIVTHSNGEDIFDDVILACHAPHAQSLLGDGFEHQASILSAMETVNNTAVLHCDPALMPKRKRAWASWNVIKGSGNAISLSYWMNRLQNIDHETPLFLTLNPEKTPKPETVFDEFNFTHPMFNMEASKGVAHIKRVNGRDGLWFAGAWMGHGFHEDGLKSGLTAALSLGGQTPWETVGIEVESSVPDSSHSDVEHKVSAAQ